MKVDHAAGLKILRKVAEDERNWRAGMQSVEELLTIAQAADEQFRGLEKRRADLEGLVASLEKQSEDAQRTESSARERARTATDATKKLEQEFEARHALLEKYGRAESLDAQIAEKEAALKHVTAAFEQFKIEHRM